MRFRLYLEGGGCSEPRSCHCTPAWMIEQDSISTKQYIKKGILFSLIHVLLDSPQQKATEDSTDCSLIIQIQAFSHE